MSRSLNCLPSVVAAVVIASAALSWASAKTDWDKDAQQRKAEYIFLESQSAYSDNKFDKYISLIERAYALDSSDIDIAGEWAMLSLMDENSDSAKIEKSYDLLKKRFYSNPSNYTTGAVLANIAQQQMRYGDAVNIWETLDSIFPTRPEIGQELARAYLRAYILGDSIAFDKAMTIYDRMQEGSGRSLDLSYQKINAYYIKKDTVAIVNELDSLSAHTANNSEAAMFIGANYQYLDMPDRAIKYYDLACELDSTNGTAYLQRAKFYNEQGDSVAFDREVFLALKSQNLDVESKIGILRSYVSELYTDSLQEPRIKQLFNELQLMHPGEPEIHSLYGAYLYERNDYNGAAEQFSYVTALNPADESAWSSYAQISAMAGDTATVISAATEAMQRFPNQLYYPILLSNIYRMNDQNDKALEVLNSVDVSEIRNERAVSNFLTSKADTYSVTGDTIKALEIYDEAIALNPDNNMALNNAAYFIALTGGDLDKAERYSARSLQGDELNPTYLDTYAWVFFKKKDYQMAKQYIDIALNSYRVPTSETDSTVLGMPYVDENAQETTPIYDENEIVEVYEVEEVLDEAIESEPSADIYDHAGDIYFMNGEPEQALEFWKKSYELNPDDKLVEQKVKLKTILLR